RIAEELGEPDDCVLGELDDCLLVPFVVLPEQSSDLDVGAESDPVADGQGACRDQLVNRHSPDATGPVALGFCTMSPTHDIRCPLVAPRMSSLTSTMVNTCRRVTTGQSRGEERSEYAAGRGRHGRERDRHPSQG